MEGIDFKAITAEVTTELGRMPLARKTGGWHRSYVTRIPVTPDSIKSGLLFSVWEKCFEILNSQGKNDEPLAVEKALTILTRADVIKEKIQFKKNSFRVQLANSQYRIYKTSDTYVYACPWPSDRKCRVHVSGETLADFMMSFDEEVPAIVSQVSTIMATISARELEEKKHLMEEEIKDKLVQSLIDQYLKPLGLSAMYNVGAGDVVVLDLKKVVSTHIEVPLCQLANKLKDTAAIVDSLRVET